MVTSIFSTSISSSSQAFKTVKMVLNRWINKTTF